MTKHKHHLAWYKLFIERKIKKLEIALMYLDQADKYLNERLVHTANYFLTYAKEYLKQ